MTNLEKANQITEELHNLGFSWNELAIMVREIIQKVQPSRPRPQSDLAS